MGYRHYLGIIDKEKLEELKKQKFDDCFDFEKEVQENCRAIFELGKLYTDKETTDALYENWENLLEEKSDTELFVPNQKIFLTLANVYREKVKKYYSDIIEKIGKKFDLNILKEEQKQAIYELITDCREKINWLELQFKENAKDVEITWLYEHQMFNLMHYYLITNYEKEVIVCFAY